MKKLSAISFFLILTVCAFAQVNFGVKAGVNFSSWTGADASGTSSLTGFYAGALANIPVSTMFSVQPELLYSGEGAKETGTDNKVNVGYINIPVLLQYNSSPVSGFYVETGPQLGLLISAKSKEGGTSTDVKSSFKSTAVSWVLGIGYKFAEGLGIGGRYSFGLTRLPSESGSGTDVKENVISFGVFKMFGGGHASMKKRR